MSGPVGLHADDEPLGFAPEPDAPELTEVELLADMREAQVLHGREYARDLESVARLASRRLRRAELGTADGRGGPGVDARASTDCENLCCLCRRHHRIKTHAPGWSFHLHGRTLVVRTPAGTTRTTDPPGWYRDPEPDPPWHDDTAPPDPMQE